MSFETRKDVWRCWPSRISGVLAQDGPWSGEFSEQLAEADMRIKY